MLNTYRGIDINTTHIIVTQFSDETFFWGFSKSQPKSFTDIGVWRIKYKKQYQTTKI